MKAAIVKLLLHLNPKADVNAFGLQFYKLDEDVPFSNGTRDLNDYEFIEYIKNTKVERFVNSKLYRLLKK